MANKAKQPGCGSDRRTTADDRRGGINNAPAVVKDAYNWDDIREKRAGEGDRRGGTNEDKDGIKTTKNQQAILENIAKNPSVTAAQLAPVVGISSRKIEANIQKLKALGLVERAGARKNGHWVVKSQE